MTAVFDAPAPQGTDRLLLLALADTANDAGVCWPSVGTLQRKCGLASRRAAEKALRRVEAWSERVARGGAEAGCVWLRVEERVGHSSLYRLVLAGATPEPGDGGTPEPQDGPTPEPWDGGPPNARTDEPSLNPHLNPQQQQRPEARRPAPPLRTRGTVCRIGDVLPRPGASPEGTAHAAAAFLGGGEEDAVLALARRGVDRAVARRLARQHPERIAPAVERFDSERGKPKGPGWLVAAIREGYAGAATAPLLSYAEMLAVCDREGVTTAAFEAVPQGAGAKPLWRRKAVAPSPTPTQSP